MREHDGGPKLNTGGGTMDLETKNFKLHVSSKFVIAVATALCMLAAIRW